MGNKLTDKQERFCQEYIKDSNATQSALRAGYAKANADKQGHQLIENTRVKERIEVLQARVAKKCEVKAEEILNHLNTLRKAKISDYVNLVTREFQTGYDEDGSTPIFTERQVIEFKDFSELSEDQLMCIESIKEGKNGLELKLHGKDWSIEKINKHIGFYEKDNDQKTPDASIINVYYLGDKIDLSS